MANDREDWTIGDDGERYCAIGPWRANEALAKADAARAKRAVDVAEMLDHVESVVTDGEIDFDDVTTPEKAKASQLELIAHLRDQLCADEDVVAAEQMPSAGERCRACEKNDPSVGDGFNTLPFCKPCAKAHGMGYRCGQEFPDESVINEAQQKGRDAVLDAVCETLGWSRVPLADALTEIRLMRESHRAARGPSAAVSTCLHQYVPVCRLCGLSRDQPHGAAARSSGEAVEVIEPAPGSNAPDLARGYMLRGAPHTGLCSCSECAALKRSHRVDVVPFAVLDPKSRAKGEPTATIEYGGVRILIGLTFLRSLSGALMMDARKSSYGASMHVCAAALDEIERRMWRAAEFTPKESGGT